MREGMIGMYFAVGNANHLPPWGGVEMLLSTNPIAVAIPAGEEPPIVLDMATTVAAFGKVKTKAQRGEQMPEGWMVDREGRPLTDPKRVHEGFLLPLGGHEGGYKGYGMALVFGILAGTLNNAAMGRDVIDFNADDSSPTNTGQALLAIDIAAFDDLSAFKRRMDELSRDIRGSERMKGFERIFLPGEQSRERHAERYRLGIPMPSPLLASLERTGSETGYRQAAHDRLPQPRHSREHHRRDAPRSGALRHAHRGGGRQALPRARQAAPGAPGRIQRRRGEARGDGPQGHRDLGHLSRPSGFLLWIT